MLTESASVEVQDRVADVPTRMLSGTAEMLTVGSGYAPKPLFRVT
jgi:hypothetical protein